MIVSSFETNRVLVSNCFETEPRLSKPNRGQNKSPVIESISPWIMFSDVKLSPFFVSIHAYKTSISFPFLIVLTGKKCRQFKVNATTTIGIKYESKWFKSRYYLPLEKGTTIPFNKRTFPSSKNALFQVWLKYGTMIFEMMIFIRRQLMYFGFFAVISP